MKVTLYSLPGCGPCEVAKQFLQQQGVPFDFVDVRGEGVSEALTAKLGEPTRGVVLADGDHAEVMLGVSLPALRRWLAAYRARQR
jgi:glutaredoxin